MGIGIETIFDIVKNNEEGDNYEVDPPSQTEC